MTRKCEHGCNGCDDCTDFEEDPMTQQAQAEALALHVLDEVIAKHANDSMEANACAIAKTQIERLYARVQELIETLYAEVQHSACLKAQLESQQAAVQMPEPVAAQCRFSGNEWGACHPEHHAMVMRHPEEWPGYEVRILYTGQQVRAMVAAQAVPGWKLVPDADNMTDEQAEAVAELARVCGGGALDIYRAALAAAPTPPAQERKPLTDEQIDALWGGEIVSVPQLVNRRAISRSIERAHGIGATNAD